ncbi:MAG: hypothetical protein WBP03_01040 [Candidatus Saccharimonadales bacterium]
MNGMILPAIVVLVPALAVAVLRSSGAMVFLSVCLGSVLATFVAGDASSILSSATPDSGATAMQWAQLGLLVIPVIATVVLTRKKAKGSKLVLGIITALAAGVLLALLAAPYMTEDMRSALTDNELWHQIENLQTAVVIGGAVLVLGNLFMTRYKPEPKEKKHK